MRRAVVTGGSGFLGSHIADALTRSGIAVTIFDARPSPWLRPDQAFVEGDILDEDAVRQAVAGADCVFHLAGLSDLNEGKRQPRGTALLNLVGTVNTLEAARRTGARRFLFASTVYVYSREGGFYRCSKQACEAYVEEYHRQFGLEYTILRYGSLYGPRATRSNGVYRLLSEALTAGVIRYAGSPHDAREYVHVEDAARLSVRALAEEFASQHLVITGQYPMRISDLFTMFSEILGRELDVRYDSVGSAGPDGHYSITPYAFTPKVGRKITTSCHVDMGQGILQLLEQLSGELRPAGVDVLEDELARP